MKKITKIVRVRLGSAKTLTKASPGIFLENGVQQSDIPMA